MAAGTVPLFPWVFPMTDLASDMAQRNRTHTHAGAHYPIGLDDLRPGKNPLDLGPHVGERYFPVLRVYEPGTLHDRPRRPRALSYPPKPLSDVKTCKTFLVDDESRRPSTTGQ